MNLQSLVITVLVSARGVRLDELASRVRDSVVFPFFENLFPSEVYHLLTVLRFIRNGQIPSGVLL